jgi:drug/metabolite transporter (DMT)-like permease
MLLAIVGGLGFGFFFITMRLTNSLGVFPQMALVRAACLLSCVAMLSAMRWSRREKQIPCGNDSKKSNSWLGRTALLGALGVALLDTGGNMLFTLATRLGRLDIAAVLASLYPAGTILLAAWQLHERPTRRQLSGMGVALAAVVLITV